MVLDPMGWRWLWPSCDNSSEWNNSLLIFYI
jgi:hypothetical protein